MAKYYEISSASLDLSSIEKIIDNKSLLKLSRKTVKLIKSCRSFLDHKMATEGTPIYGVNTGFGSLYKESIEVKDLQKLQQNLIKSHACGTGDEVPQEIVKIMLLLIKVLAIRDHLES